MKKVLQKSEQRLKDYWGKTKKYYSHYRYVYSFLFAVVLLIAAVFVFYIDIKEITFVNFISGVIAVVGLVLFFRRVKHQVKIWIVEINQRWFCLCFKTVNTS